MLEISGKKGVLLNMNRSKKWFACGLVVMIFILSGCGREESPDLPLVDVEKGSTNEVAAHTEDDWNPESYESLEDMIQVTEMDDGNAGTSSGQMPAVTYRVRYQSGECQVVAYLSIPKKCLEEKQPYPCIIYNRGGNRDYMMLKMEDIKNMAESSGKIVFASQYRGVGGGTGKDEFGGADLQDVLKLVDLCQEFAFVDQEELYMMGVSRGGMMTYMAMREDARIKKGVVISGDADLFMEYEEREDMREVLEELIGGTPKELPKEYEKRSAAYWAEELLCPVLIIHSRQDKLVSFGQAEKMVTCLEDAKKEYQFVTYEDDTHGMHPEDFEIIMEWMQ